MIWYELPQKEEMKLQSSVKHRERQKGNVREDEKLEFAAQTDNRHEADSTAAASARASETSFDRPDLQANDHEARRAARQQERPLNQLNWRASHQSAMQESQDLEGGTAEQQRLKAQRQSQNVASRLLESGIVDEIGYMDLRVVNVEGRFCKALHFKEKRVVSSSRSQPLSSQCFSKEHFSFSALLEPFPLFRQLLTVYGLLQGKLGETWFRVLDLQSYSLYAGTDLSLQGSAHSHSRCPARIPVCVNPRHQL